MSRKNVMDLTGTELNVLLEWNNVPKSGEEKVRDSRWGNASTILWAMVGGGLGKIGLSKYEDSVNQRQSACPIEKMP